MCNTGQRRMTHCDTPRTHVEHLSFTLSQHAHVAAPHPRIPLACCPMAQHGRVVTTCDLLTVVHDCPLQLESCVVDRHGQRKRKPAAYPMPPCQQTSWRRLHGTPSSRTLPSTHLCNDLAPLRPSWRSSSKISNGGCPLMSSLTWRCTACSVNHVGIGVRSSVHPCQVHARQFTHFGAALAADVIIVEALGGYTTAENIEQAAGPANV